MPLLTVEPEAHTLPSEGAAAGPSGSDHAGGAATDVAGALIASLGQQYGGTHHEDAEDITLRVLARSTKSEEEGDGEFISQYFGGKSQAKMEACEKQLAEDFLKN